MESMLRPPARIVTSDIHGNQLLVAAQVLHVFGLYDGLSLAGLNRIAQRMPQQVDDKAWALQLLFRHGLQAYEINPFDLEAQRNSYSAWLQDGKLLDPQLTDSEETRVLYERWLVFANAVSVQLRAHPQSWGQEPRWATPDDIDAGLKDGGLVILPLGNVRGAVVLGLIYGQTPKGWYKIYHPFSGAQTWPPEYINPNNKLQISIWRRAE